MQTPNAALSQSYTAATSCGGIVSFGGSARLKGPFTRAISSRRYRVGRDHLSRKKIFDIFYYGLFQGDIACLKSLV